MGIKRYQFLIEGRVQGVFFRASTQHEACRLGITGWAKNLADGRVEVIAQGDEIALKQLELWLQQGPKFASVTQVVSEELPLENNLIKFSVF